MRVNSVNQYSKQNNYKSSAASGALATSALLGTSTAVSLVKHPDAMANVIKDCGGKAGYIKQYTKGLALMATMGAIFFTTGSFIMNKLSRNKNNAAAALELKNAKACPEKIETISRVNNPNLGKNVKYAVNDRKIVDGKEQIIHRERMQDGTTRVFTTYV